MPDYERFEDFAPAGFEIPERARLFAQIDTLYKLFQLACIESVQEPLDEFDREALDLWLKENEAKNGEALFPCFSDGKPYSMEFQGGDAIKISDINSPDMYGREDGIYYAIDLTIYRDHSPYLPDELIEKGITDPRWFAVISPVPEEPPVLISFEEFDTYEYEVIKHRLNGEVTETSKLVNNLTNFIITKQEAGEQLIYLTDEECVGLFIASQQLQIDRRERLIQTNGIKPLLS